MHESNTNMELCQACSALKAGGRQAEGRPDGRSVFLRVTIFLPAGFKQAGQL